MTNLAAKNVRLHFCTDTCPENVCYHMENMVCWDPAGAVEMSKSCALVQTSDSVQKHALRLSWLRQMTVQQQCRRYFVCTSHSNRIAFSRVSVFSDSNRRRIRSSARPTTSKALSISSIVLPNWQCWASFFRCAIE